MQKTCSGIKLKQVNDFKLQDLCNPGDKTEEEFSAMQLNTQLLDIVEKFCFVGDTTEVRARDFYVTYTNEKIKIVNFTKFEIDAD